MEDIKTTGGIFTEESRRIVITNICKVGEVALVHTGDDVEGYLGMPQDGVDGLAGSLETQVVAAQPVVLRLESVEADGQRVEPCMAQFVETFGCEQQSVGHHAPRKATVEDFTSHDGEVVAE